MSARDESFDVVVCGFGGAGACAAIEASRAGARVLALERSYVSGLSRADRIHAGRPADASVAAGRGARA